MMFLYTINPLFVTRITLREYATVGAAPSSSGKYHKPSGPVPRAAAPNGWEHKGRKDSPVAASIFRHRRQRLKQAEMVRVLAE